MKKITPRVLLLCCCTLLGCENESAPLVGEDFDLPEGRFGEALDMWLPALEARQIDILFVIGNSRGTGREQGVLASSLASMVEQLDDPEVGADYRVAFTTTDVGSPWCVGTTPESGNFVYGSCLDREASFTSQDGSENDFARACSDHCSLDDAALGIDGQSPPWFEAKMGSSSLFPEGVSTAEAIACLAPQGVDGCGFEAPLEAMRTALARMNNADSPEFEFHRREAKFVVIFLSEENDCSVDPDHLGIFDENGAKAFWSDPDADPTSAICWNAGVICEGEPDALDCRPEHYDETGETTTWAFAVMKPVYNYLQSFASFADPASFYSTHAIAISGVDLDGVPHYRSDVDPEILNTYGIGPGCETEPYVTQDPCTVDDDCPQIGATCGAQGTCELPERAFPPVRLVEFIDEYGLEQGMYSICQDDYADALAPVVERVRFTGWTECYEDSVYDSDPSTPLLEPECLVAKTYGGQWNWNFESADAAGWMSECSRSADGNYETTPEGDYLIPEDAGGICYALRVDPGGLTPSPADDLPENCDDNLAIELQMDYTLAPEGLSSAHMICRLE